MPEGTGVSPRRDCFGPAPGLSLVTRRCHPERSRFSGVAKDLPLNPALVRKLNCTTTRIRAAVVGKGRCYNQELRL